jgi:hypothetical protein
MEIAVEKSAIIGFFLIGVSQIVQPRAAAEFFVRLREKGTTCSFINARIMIAALGGLLLFFVDKQRGSARENPNGKYEAKKSPDSFKRSRMRDEL